MPYWYKVKILSSLILILFFAPSMYYLFVINPMQDPSGQTMRLSMIFSGYLFSIIAGYVLLGRWGLLIAALSVGSAAYTAHAHDNALYWLYAIPFAATAVAYQEYVRRTGTERQLIAHKLRELTREINQLRGESKRNGVLQGQLQKKLDRYLELKELIELLSSSLHSKELIHFITDQTFDIIGKSERMLLFLIDEHRQELALSGSRKRDMAEEIKSKKGDAFDRWVLDQRRPLMIGDVTKDDRFGTPQEADCRSVVSLISAPMILEDRMLGLVRLESLERNAYTVDDLRILYVIADIAAVAINNAHLYARTEELAIKDGLTGLYVHRYFKKRLTDELKRAERREDTFSLLMMDIDHFKHYNDKYGHAAGDVVLQHIANSLCQFADSGDVIARYGGEEFAVILAKEDKKGAAVVAENIRKHIAKDSLKLRGHQAHVTVSIGISTYPEDGTHEEGIIRVADENLYCAKREGRNRVCS